MGGSSGAACAFTMAWFHPELYRRVLTYSGTYVNQQSPLNPASPHGAWEYHATLIPNSPAKPMRVWMEVSENDNGTDQDETWHNWVLANERMAAALKAKGYHYRYVYSQDSRHVDRAVVTQTLPEALEWLWKGYPPGVRPVESVDRPAARSIQRFTCLTPGLTWGPSTETRTRTASRRRRRRRRGGRCA